MKPIRKIAAGSSLALGATLLVLGMPSTASAEDCDGDGIDDGIICPPDEDLGTLDDVADDIGDALGGDDATDADGSTDADGTDGPPPVDDVGGEPTDDDGSSDDGGTPGDDDGSSDDGGSAGDGGGDDDGSTTPSPQPNPAGNVGSGSVGSGSLGTGGLTGVTGTAGQLANADDTDLPDAGAPDNLALLSGLGLLVVGGLLIRRPAYPARHRAAL